MGARSAVARKSGKQLHVLILAAGMGKRMKSARIKLLHDVAGRAMIDYVLDAASRLEARHRLIVLGNQAEAVGARVPVNSRAARETGLAPFQIVLQKEQLGTGHAVMQAKRTLAKAGGDVLVLNGDLPGIQASTLRDFVARHRKSGAAASLLTAVLPDPAGYGRILREIPSGKSASAGGRGEFTGVVEHADATAEQKRIAEINVGIYCFSVDHLFRLLEKIEPANRQGEYYLPDVLGLLLAEKKKVQAVLHPESWEILGVNSRADLALTSRRITDRRASALMDEGVTLIDPAAVSIGPDVRIGRDTIVEPNVTLRGKTTIGSGVTLMTGSFIRDATIGDDVVVLPYCVITEATVGRGTRIGPFAHLRPGTVLAESVHIGNFVETKKTTLGRGSKANHLTYLGDATIGEKVNVGAGTITCNYDGVTKSPTFIEDGAFIGSDTALVAPVRVGKGAYIGAGSTITQDVPARSLGIARSRQRNVEGWVDRKNRNK